MAINYGHKPISNQVKQNTGLGGFMLFFIIIIVQLILWIAQSFNIHRRRKF